MTLNLPAAFCERMKNELGDEYEAFLLSYEKPRKPALRVNPLKMTTERFLAAAPFTLSPVPWCKEGYYYDPEEHPGRHPWHEAGIYYIQEPSAMAVAAMSGVRPGETVLDLCAAPGGKSTQLAGMMDGQGLLISNEIHPQRARILSSNIERMGIRNAVVTNETPEKLADRFPVFFDRIIVDAPCSGEGMFRKEEAAIPNWSPENVHICAERQRSILTCAAQMLKSGGTLIYSTCTFSREENEENIAWFLREYPDFQAADLPEMLGETMEAWGFAGSSDGKSLRLLPHRLDGEGHFLARLTKGAANTRPAEEINDRRGKGGHGKDSFANKSKAVTLRDALSLYQGFAEECLTRMPEGEPLLFGNELYLLPRSLHLDGIRVLRPGLHLGTVKKGRFEPSHSLAKALSPSEVKNVYTVALSERNCMAYLKGESLPADPSEKGWTLVQTDGCSLGWGKTAGGMLKNHYPKGIRIMA
jgi:NOL1/NOP2/sun family putative RNA methylase